MLFNSLEFMLFLPIVFLLYWYVFNKNLKLQNIFIVLVSYIFYGWWDWRFLYLIAFTSFLSWLSGVLMDFIRKRNLDVAVEKRYCKITAGTNILINLLILGIFKYYDFFVISLIEAFGSIGISLQITSLKLVLPVGISFYTFQALSYSIDVYRKTLEPTKDVVAFFAYVSFFPQLVAGPIERATNLLPQFYKQRVFDYTKAVDGMRQMLWGFFKKVVIADNCASMVNMIFDGYQEQSSLLLFIGALLFAFQIYGDFSGYSDIAIGSARLFGIELRRNFHFPYFSRDIAEFWRRWHISLNTWFRDYLYIPLGGSRCGKFKRIRNTLIIFTLSGLWHGANWTYLVWGVFHGISFLPLLLSNRNRKNLDVVAPGRFIPSFSEGIKMLLTFFWVVIGWVIFRAETIQQAFDYILRMFGGIGEFSLETLPFSRINFFATVCFIGLLMLTEWVQRSKEHALDLTVCKSPLLRWSIYVVLIMMLFIFPGKEETFIYFQF